MLPDITFRELILWLLGKRKRFRVTGNSMFPLLTPGEEVLIDLNIYQKQLPEVGDIVIAQHPTQKDLQLIKRVVTVKENGSCLLLGDNPTASTDSRKFGEVKLHLIQGRVTCRFG